MHILIHNLDVPDAEAQETVSFLLTVLSGLIARWKERIDELTVDVFFEPLGSDTQFKPELEQVMREIKGEIGDVYLGDYPYYGATFTVPNTYTPPADTRKRKDKRG